MERLRKGLSIFAAAALLAPASGALAGRPVFHHHRADHDGEEADHQSDRGAKPAKSPAGDLTLRSRALLGKDGKTQLEISTAAFDIGGTPPGNISHVHVRAVDPRGRSDDDDDKDGDEGKELRFRREYNHLRGGGYFTDTYTGLPHGLNLRIEAKARGASRRDEVEAKWLDVIHYRPDLVVTQINAPAKVHLNTTVDLTAVIKEAMGEVGAHADCVLSIDGVEETRATDAWIDAGGSTTCLLTATFPVAGKHTLTVSAQNVRPGDYDYSNNALSTQIEVLNPIIPIYTAQVTETTWENVVTLDTYNSSASTTPDAHQPTTTTKVEQQRSFLGTIPNAVSLSQPLKFSYSDSSGGRALSAVTYPSIALDSAGNFLDDDSLNSGRLLVIRRSEAGAGSTNITFTWTTSDTVVYSQKTCSTLALSCVGFEWTAGPVNPTNVVLGDDYSAAVVLDDGTPYSANPAMTLTPFGSTTLVRVRDICVPLAGTRGGRRCFLTDTATYGKRGGAMAGPQTASLP